MSAPAAAEAAAPPAKGNKLLIIIVLVFNVLLAGAVGYTVVMGQAKAGAEKQAEPAHEEPEPGKFGPVIEIGELVANLSGPLSTHYIKVQLHVEAQNEEVAKRLEAAVVPIRSEALLYLNDLEFPKDGSQVQIRLLSEELCKRLNELVGKDSIKKVYFAEFVVQ